MRRPACRRIAATSGSSRGSWSRCATWPGPRRGCCASRSSCASATTSGRRSVRCPTIARRRLRSRRLPGPRPVDAAVGAARREEGPVHEPRPRSSGPTRATPRATSSSTTARSRPGSCRTCATGPLVLTRFPDGIKGKSFFQKDAPGFAPGWVRIERIWSEQAEREIDYFVADDVETLLYVANLGTIPLHVWGSRVSDLPAPRLVHPRPRPQDRAPSPTWSRWRGRSATWPRRSRCPPTRRPRARRGSTC